MQTFLHHNKGYTNNHLHILIGIQLKMQQKSLPLIAEYGSLSLLVDLTLKLQKCMQGKYGTHQCA